MHIHEAGIYSIEGQGVGQEITRSAVDRSLCNDMFSLFCKGLDRISDCGGAGGDRKAGNASLQRGDALFENILCRIGQAAINVSGICQAEAIRGMLAVMKDIGCRCVYGDRTGVGRGIGQLLPRM